MISKMSAYSERDLSSSCAGETLLERIHLSVDLRRFVPERCEGLPSPGCFYEGIREQRPEALNGIPTSLGTEAELTFEWYARKKVVQLTETHLAYRTMRRAEGNLEFFASKAKKIWCARRGNVPKEVEVPLKVAEKLDYLEQAYLQAECDYHLIAISALRPSLPNPGELYQPSKELTTAVSELMPGKIPYESADLRHFEEVLSKAAPNRPKDVALKARQLVSVHNAHQDFIVACQSGSEGQWAQAVAAHAKATRILLDLDYIQFREG